MYRAVVSHYRVMDMTRVKEEALANAARNKSSEQVSLVCQQKQTKAKENKCTGTEQMKEKEDFIENYSNSTNKKCENILDLIDKECKNTEEHITKRMEVLVEEMVKNIDITAEDYKTKKSDIVQCTCACRSKNTKYEKAGGREGEIKLLIGKSI